MEVKEANDGLLTNLEVLDLIKERREGRLGHGESKLGIESQHREYIEQKVIIHRIMGVIMIMLTNLVCK
jgi:hypothetical protein